jgi:hypothetical protein
MILHLAMISGHDINSTDYKSKNRQIIKTPVSQWTQQTVKRQHSEWKNIVNNI